MLQLTRVRFLTRLLDLTLFLWWSGTVRSIVAIANKSLLNPDTREPRLDAVIQSFCLWDTYGHTRCLDHSGWGNHGQYCTELYIWCLGGILVFCSCTCVGSNFSWGVKFCCCCPGLRSPAHSIGKPLWLRISKGPKLTSKSWKAETATLIVTHWKKKYAQSLFCTLVSFMGMLLSACAWLQGAFKCIP